MDRRTTEMDSPVILEFIRFVLIDESTMDEVG